MARKRAASPLDDALIAAVEGNRLDEVQALLAQGANPDAKKGRRRALDLVDPRRPEIAHALVEAGAEAKDRNLMWGVHSRRLSVVEALLAQGADPNLDTHSGTPVQVAASLGEVEIVRRLLAAGADPDAGSRVSTPLLAAIEAGQAASALALLEGGADPSHGPSFGQQRPLVQAAGAGQLEVVRTLLARGADPDAASPYSPVSHAALVERMLEGDEVDLRAATPVDSPPVIAAARGGHAEVVRALLAAGADPRVRDGEGRTAFERGREGGHEAVLVALREAGVTGEERTAAEQLLVAAEQGDASAVRAALGDGAPVDARDPRQATRGFTALVHAARAGHLDAVEALLAAGADPRQTDAPPDVDAALVKRLHGMGEASAVEAAGARLGRGPLTHAAAGGHATVARALLDAGAPVDAADLVGHTALHVAAAAGHLDLVRLLVERGADVGARGPGKATALLLAAQAGHADIVRLLLAAGGDRKRAPRPSFHELQAAASHADAALVRDLLAAGADAKKKASKDATPLLMTAAMASRWVPVPGSTSSRQLEPFPAAQVVEVVRVLLAAGADPDEPSSGLGTPLMQATREGHLEVVEALLAAGADPAARHGDEDALAVARRYERPAIAAALEAALARRPATRPPAGQRRRAKEPRARRPRPIRRPSFARAARARAFRELVDELGRRCGSRPVAVDDLAGASLIHVATRLRATLDTEALQRELLPRGAFVFEPDRTPGRGPAALVVVPAADPLDVVAAVQTAGPNVDVGPGDVVAFLHDLRAAQPFVLTTIAHDTLAGRFLEPVKDARALAKRMYDLCPDIVDQGTGTVEALAAELEASGRLFFWWD